MKRYLSVSAFIVMATVAAPAFAQPATDAAPTGVEKGAPPPAGTMLSADKQPCASFKKNSDGSWTNIVPLLVNGVSTLNRTLRNTTETKWLDHNCPLKTPPPVKK